MQKLNNLTINKLNTNNGLPLKPIKIGNLIINNPIILAPMAGITDIPYRSMVNSFGSSLMYSEMISSNAITKESIKSLKMANISSNSITGIQFAGSNIKILVEACKIAEDKGAALIDINMGCPVKKVTNGIAGSALMKDECLAAEIMESMVKATNLPVTVKMRLGWDFDSINSPKLAQIAEQSGIKAITVHGRTRQQFFNDTANWHIINNVVNAVNIPVIVNGDIKDINSAITALQQSKAAGVMIGRATYGKPWLINEIINKLQYNKTIKEPSIAEKLSITLQHLDLILNYYGKVNGLKIARKHLSWYTKGLDNSANFRASINISEDYNQVINLLKQCFLSNCNNLESQIA